MTAPFAPRGHVVVHDHLEGEPCTPVRAAYLIGYDGGLDLVITGCRVRPTLLTRLTARLRRP